MGSAYSRVLTKPILKFLYTDLEKTDREIASFFHLDRTTVVHARNDFGIKARESIGRKGELVAIQKLQDLGHEVKDMNAFNSLSEFDLLLDKSKKIEVKTASLHNERYYFILTEKESHGMIISENRIRLNNGRTKKVFENTCDFILFVGLREEGSHNFWLMEPCDIPLKLQTLSISITSSKYSIYRNNWHLIERGENQ